MGMVSLHAESNIRLGIDCLVDSGFQDLKGKRVGLVTNPSGVDSYGRSTIEILRKSPKVNLVSLFAPEHGIKGTVKAGEYVSTYTDKETGLTVHSLYGPTRKPTPEMLRSLDTIVYDLQDIGCRSYTFISTLGLVMEAAREAQVEVMVLDRPNPLGGLRIEGPRTVKKFQSFVGMYDVPYVYGLTIGELAHWINTKHLERPCTLKVVEMVGWKRNMVWEDTGLEWVPTSPNIPNTRSVRGYAATGLLGEIGIANGANDKLPFELMASEGIDSKKLARYMNQFDLKGIRFEPFSFYPSSGKYQSICFSGVRMKMNPDAPGNLTAVSFYAIPYFRKRFPKRDYFRPPRKRGEIRMFDKLCGSDHERRALQRGVSPAKIVEGWQEGITAWKVERIPFLLYP